jgi:hypothetical protein
MFWQRALDVREVLLTATRPDSTVYSLIAYQDGGLGIARDGVPLTPFYWASSEDIDECVTVFMRLAGLESRNVHASAGAN